MTGNGSAPVDYKALVRDDRIHGSLYTDPRVFEDELERIFHRGWVFVGHASEVARTGDFVTRSIGAQPVIMVRARDGEIAVLLNRCAHRGTMVCTTHHLRDVDGALRMSRRRSCWSTRPSRSRTSPS
jgi:fatty-acyl-CoA synthase